jgi:hypothetical protein
LPPLIVLTHGLEHLVPLLPLLVVLTHVLLPLVLPSNQALLGCPLHDNFVPHR